MNDFVLAITGASGSIYGVRLLDVLLATGNNVHLTISPAACQVFEQELGLKVNLDKFELSPLLQAGDFGARLNDGGGTGHGSSIFTDSDIVRGRITYHHFMDFSAGIASGSFPTSGMVICPCSMGTLAGIAHGLSTNLIQRAADVHLKERRKLIVVPRETPLGSIQLQNMKTLSDAGGVILPAAPGFYHRPLTVHDLVDFVVGRICDQLGLRVELMKRWGSETPPRPHKRSN